MSGINRDTPAGAGLHLVTTDDPRSLRLAEVADALAARRPGLTVVRRHDPGGEAPHFLLPGGVRYVGLPEGREEGPFVDILHGRLPAPPRALIELLAVIRLPAAVGLYVSARCTFCPLAVRSLAPLGLAQPLFRLTVIDAELFPEMAARDRVQALPTLVIDGGLRWSGTIDPAEVAGLLANRDPAAIGPTALEMMLKEGRAREVAGMMQERGRVFPSLIELLVHDQWPVRLGAMVTVEELAAVDPDLAHAVLDLLWDRFAAAGGPARGDILYLAGDVGRRSDIDRIQAMAAEDASADVREAAEEAVAQLMNKLNYNR